MLLHNGAHEHRVEAYRWAYGLASILGLARPRKADLEDIDPATPDARRAAAWRQLVRRGGPERTLEPLTVQRGCACDLPPTTRSP